MLEILQAEGWNLKEHELNRLRKKYDLRLRGPNAVLPKKRKRAQTTEEENEENGQASSNEPASERLGNALLNQEVAPEIVAKRQERKARLLAESEERFRAGTRRRRTGVWSGLPPDPVAPPRYPSELTFSEGKVLLGLDRAMYRGIRETFANICRTNNIVKKTSTGASKWKDVKDMLISQTPHLQATFWGPNSAALDQNREPMALELICIDVTKSLRNMESHISLTDAKRILQLTPQEGRDIRTALDEILKANFFVSKLEEPPERWETLKAQWLNGSALLQQKLAGGIADPEFGLKLKSIDTMAADVQKRIRNHQTKLELQRSQSGNSTVQVAQMPPLKDLSTGATSVRQHAPTHPSQSEVSSTPHPEFGFGHISDDSVFSLDALPAQDALPQQEAQLSISPSNQTRTSHLPPQTRAVTTSRITATADTDNNAPNTISTPSPSHFQIDPTLLQAAFQPPQPVQSNTPSDDVINASVMSPPLPVYFRLSPSSPRKFLSTHVKVWLATLHAPYTLAGVVRLAGSKAGGGAKVVKVEGVAAGSSVGVGGGWSIDEDDELEAYLEMVREAGGKGKATFVVELQ